MVFEELPDFTRLLPDLRFAQRVHFGHSVVVVELNPAEPQLFELLHLVRQGNGGAHFRSEGVASLVNIPRSY